MREMRKRLEDDLALTMSRLRQMRSAVDVDELCGPTGSNTPFADESDEMVAREEREVRFGTRELLVNRVNQITAALARLSSGEYGVCRECGQPIAVARLRALPEVETCVGCQARIERYGRPLETSRMDADTD
jgi:DnaK suppressor protein